MLRSVTELQFTFQSLKPYAIHLMAACMGANVLTLMNAPALMDGMGKSVNKVKCLVADFYHTLHLLILW